MAKNPSESRIPRAARPSFLPKPKIITPLKQHVGGTINCNSRRSTILSGYGSFMNELHEEAIPKTPKGRLSGLPCLASTPNPEGILEQTYVSPPIWGIKGTEALQYDLKRECKEEEEEELFGSLHGQLSMLEDISSGCLIEPTLGNTLNETTASGLSATTHQYLSLNKQNSFEHEESLGILTPDQMTDFTVALGCSRTPSCENLTGSRGILATSVAAAATTAATITTTTTSSSSSRGSRPTDVQFTVDNTESHVLISERSPSLEELPLDPKPLDRVEKLFLSEHQANSINNQQTVSSVAKATAVSTSAITTSVSVTSTASLPMSFVTSVTSITSLEAGYQGDGENSRPASRGPDPPSVPPDNLPGNLPACCHQACPLQDPMTDSDFFTESDADAHEDIVRGDRRAQVIDGTLFCAPTEPRRRCPSFAGEEMESSGIYSDLDKRQDERYNIDGEPVSGDQSPDTANTPDTADTADTQVSQKIQTSLNLKPTIMPSLMDFLQVPKNSLDNTTDSNSSGGGGGGSDGGLEVTVISVESTNDTNRSVGKLQGKADSPQLKKYKMPNKNVASKIKAMIEASPKDESPKEIRRVARSRKNGHWDAVMSKIEAGKSEQRLRPPRKEIKSRFMQTITSSASISNTPTMSSPSAGTAASVKRSPGDANNNAKATKDKRRLRGRQEINSPIQETARSSVRSSMSDLSSGPTKETVSKRSITTTNQQRRAVNGRTPLKSRVTNKDTKKPLDLSPLHLEKSPNAIRKSALARRSATLNNAINSAKQQSSIPASVIKDSVRRESNSSTTISSRISIDTRQQATQTDSHYESPRIKQAEQTINALCLTIQYLTCQQDEYSEQVQAELDNLNADNVHLKEIISEEREIHEKALNDLRNDVKRKYAERIESLDNKLCEERSAFETRLKESMDELIKDHQIAINKLKLDHAAEIEVQHKLYKEEARQQLLLSSKNLREEENEVEVVKKELESLKLCVRPILIMKKRINEKLKNEKILLMKQLKEKQVKIYNLEAELEELKESNKLIPLDNSSDKSSSLHAEVWSLRSVLELRSQENASMRSEIDILRRDVEGKDTLEQRVESLEARCEDLKAQLQSKESYERTIAHQNEILLGSFHEVSKHNKRLTQRNEELQWRLRQKNEVVSALANQLAAPPRLSRSLGAEHINHSLTPEKNSQASQSSSMIKFMVQKGDSVSWTLEIDESSDSLPHNDSTAPTVSRQNSLRRTPRKSLDIRARSKSVSTSDTMREDNWTPGYNSTPVPVRRRPTSDPSSVNSGVQSSVSVKNEQQNTGGPRPQEAGGEAMISEETSATSSEDESSTSTDISRLAMEFGWSNPVE